MSGVPYHPRGGPQMTIGGMIILEKVKVMRYTHKHAE